MSETTRAVWRCDDYDQKRGRMCEHEWLKDPDPAKPPPTQCARCKSVNWNRGHATRPGGPAERYEPARKPVTAAGENRPETLGAYSTLREAVAATGLKPRKSLAEMIQAEHVETARKADVALPKTADRAAANAGSRVAHAVGCKCYLCRGAK